MYHNQQPNDGRSPSTIENHLSTSYSLTTFVSSALDFNSRDIADGKNNCFSTTTDSAYTPRTFSSEKVNYQLEDLDDLIDEVGEAEDDRAAVGIEDEDYTSIAGTDFSLWYSGSGEEEYAALEPPPNEIYLNSLLDTDIEIARPYDPKLRVDLATTPFYQISYYDGQNTEGVMEPEGKETEQEAIFTVSTAAVDDSEPDEEPNYNKKGNLEARLRS